MTTLFNQLHAARGCIKEASHRFFSLILLSIFLLSPVAYAAHEDVGGHAFSDPGYTVEMSDEWQNQLIVRDRWAQGADIAISLDQHLYPALLPLIEEYGEQHNLKIAVQEGTCGISAGNLSDKRVDIAGFCCPPGITDRLPGLNYHTLAIAPLALIVHPSSPVTSLSLNTARDVFKGKAVSWREIIPGYPLGLSKSSTIRAVGRLHCKARPGHWRLLLDNENMFSPRLIEISTIPDMVTTVAEAPEAIGYEVLMMVERFSSLGKVKVIDIDDVSPRDERAVVEGRYPLYRVYSISSWHAPHLVNDEAGKLISYIMDNMDRVDPYYGLIPVDKLRKAGWTFDNNELVGEPDRHTK